jgi:predicted RNase H-like HicB family nuclease
LNGVRAVFHRPHPHKDADRGAVAAMRGFCGTQVSSRRDRMTYKGYEGVVEYDEEAKVFTGEVIDTRDVITFQGKSVQELERAFRESVDDYLAFCKSRNEEPEKPFSGI